MQPLDKILDNDFEICEGTPGPNEDAVLVNNDNQEDILLF